MGLTKNNRMTISLSPKADRDLIEILSKVDCEFSRFVRDLMRDGLKYRGLGDTVTRTVHHVSTAQPSEAPKEMSNKPKPSPQRKVATEVTKPSKKDIKKHVEDKLDSKL